MSHQVHSKKRVWAISQTGFWSHNREDTNNTWTERVPGWLSKARKPTNKQKALRVPRANYNKNIYTNLPLTNSVPNGHPPTPPPEQGVLRENNGTPRGPDALGKSIISTVHRDT